MLTSPIRNTLKVFGRWFSCTSVNYNRMLDPLQEKALNEICFLVDDNDRVIGKASKKVCHTVTKDGKNGTIPLHRAFSVFLFNSRGDLLLQKRSKAKVIICNFFLHNYNEFVTFRLLTRNDTQTLVAVIQ